MTSKALKDIEDECARMKDVEGWTPEADDACMDGELEATASFCCTRAMPFYVPEVEGEPDRRGYMVRGAAFLVAAIERLDRATAKQAEAGQ